MKVLHYLREVKTKRNNIQFDGDSPWKLTSGTAKTKILNCHVNYKVSGLKLIPDKDYKYFWSSNWSVQADKLKKEISK